MIEDPVLFEVISSSLVSCAREMTISLRRTAFSPNIKERRDCSCAIFDRTGNLVAQSKDIPVHLGAMPRSVKACIQDIGESLTEGRMALVNDPFRGGSHLPDITLVAPVFHEGDLVAFAANRAHHADVGGSSPGSMPGLSINIHEEGAVISPRIVVENSTLMREAIDDLLSATRTPRERLGDLSAQMAANNVGLKRLAEVAVAHGWETLLRSFEELRYYSRKRMHSALSKLGKLEASFTDYMESDGAGSRDIPLSARISVDDGMGYVDFTGSSMQVEGNINCPLASTLSAVYYVFIALFGRDIPTNEGCWSVLDVEVPQGSLLNPRYPAAVSAGNVETTQRIVDVILGAFAEVKPEIIPAASQGTMNNLSIGGTDHRTGTSFSFYETIGGGAGASKGTYGTSGIHSHMTNTLNTPIEALEMSYPLRVLKYAIRRNSGGRGGWTGGDGIVREIEILTDGCTISIQSERRQRHPWGVNGGEEAKTGNNSIVFHGKEHSLEAKSTVMGPSGTIVRIQTPGGGGWGPS
ncbi:hydantoinase B/oxoprolinase family protein [Candidatus Thorarchaeota archaeon]|nr:MAG: hydantoinase B/oxoprolinase family protein [Candidatus Thorarchaeota archaeon]